jgi:hypothetical protein
MEESKISMKLETNALNKHLVKELAEKHEEFTTLLSELQKEISQFGIDNINSEYFKDLIKLSFKFSPDEIKFLKKKIETESKKEKKIADEMTNFIRSLNLFFNFSEDEND